MLQEFVEQICFELKIEMPKLDREKSFQLPINPDVSVQAKELKPGVSLQAEIAPCPALKKEELFMYLMRANFLGQGTGGSRIGLDRDEKFLTLSLGLPYEMNYQAFKEHLEDFVNYLMYWREQVAKFSEEKNLL